MQPWERLEPTTVHKEGYRVVVRKTFRLPDGQISGFDTMAAEDSHYVSTIALTADKKVILAKEFRAGPEKVLFELPGGGVEPGEDFAVAAQRELLEETGYEASNIIHLGDIYKDAYSNGTWHYYLALDCTPHPEGQQLDEREFIEVELATIDELFEYAYNCGMTDSAAVLLAYKKLQELRDE